MLKKDKDEFFLTHSELINQSIRTINEFLTERIHHDKTLKRLDNKAYNDLFTLIDSLKPLPAKFSLEEILKFSNNNIIENIEKIPKKIAELEVAGLSTSGFTPKQENININRIMEEIYNLHYFLPKKQEFLVCKPEQPDKKLNDFLVKNKLFNIIALFRYEFLAAPLRNQLAIPPLRSKNNNISNLLQRFGLYPSGNFCQIKPGPKDTIIYLGNGQKTSYFESANYLNLSSKPLGLGADVLKATVLPLDVKSAKFQPIKYGSGKIFETFDGVNFRELQTPFPDRLARGPSHIANGYNSVFNTKFKKHVGAPILDPITINTLLEYNKKKYMDLKTKASTAPRTKVVDKFLKLLVESLNIKDKILLNEVRIHLLSEKIRLERKLKNSASIDDFFDDVISDKDNFILKFERKIKVYNNKK